MNFIPKKGRLNDSTLAELINLMLDNKLTQEQNQMLQDRLAADEQARQYYYDFMDISVWMRQHASGIEDYLNEDIDVFREKIQQDLFDLAVRKAIKHQEESSEQYLPEPVMRREYCGPSLSVILWRIAAIIIICLGVIWLDRIIMRSGAIKPVQSVATLDIQHDARWNSDGIMPQVGEKLYPGTYHLESGCVMMRFYNGADVVLQSPAIIHLDQPDSLHLNLGRLCSYVHNRGIGFTVHTPSSSVIDLGTEFGVQVRPDGSSEVHMLTGKASVVSGPRGAAIRILQAGEAGAINANDGEFKSIECDETGFVRQLSRDGKTLWRGGPINLADIVGGGNGLGNGKPNQLLDVNGNSIVPFDKAPVLQRYDDYEFSHSVPCNAMIDYLFSCNLREGNEIQITSMGHKFTGIPRSAGDAKYGIANGRLPYDRPIFQGQDLSLGQPRVLHFIPSLGITFDLKAIGDNLDGVRFNQFRSTGLINEKVKSSKFACADFWVLVDGNVRFVKRKVKPSTGPFDIRVAIQPGERFLSLALTDGGNVNGDDLCLFVDPQLIVSR